MQMLFGYCEGEAEKKRNIAKMGEPPRCKWLKHTQMVIEYGIS